MMTMIMTIIFDIIKKNKGKIFIKSKSENILPALMIDEQHQCRVTNSLAGHAINEGNIETNRNRHLETK